MRRWGSIDRACSTCGANAGQRCRSSNYGDAGSLTGGTLYPPTTYVHAARRPRPIKEVNSERNAKSA